jgi:hypothetical protein
MAEALSRPIPKADCRLNLIIRHRQALSRYDAERFVRELYGLIGDIDLQWQEENPVLHIVEFPRHEVLRRYLDEILIHQP